MNWKTLGRQVIDTGAPLLGGILGGPGGAAIGGLVASAFGGDPADPVDLLNRISMDPEAAIKLRQIESTHEVELAKIILADVQSARQREIEITKTTGKLNWPQYLLAGIIVAGFFGLIFALMTLSVPDGSKDVANMLFGSLSISFGVVVSYFFGSSKGSADKNELLKK